MGRGEPPELERVSCALCGTDDAEPLLRAKDYRSERPETFQVVRCQRCGLSYTNPRPSAQDLLSLYGESYRPFRARSNPLLRWIWRRRTDQIIRRWQEMLPPGGNLLEVGCGTGETLAALRDEGGWAVTGVEPSPYACRVARERRGLNVYQGSLPHIELEANSFDGIIMRHTLEHVPDPLVVVKRAFRALRPGGRCFILVPNLASMEARIFGSRWYDLDLPRHLYHFTPATLTHLLKEGGFRVVGLRSDRAPNGWVGSLRHLLQDARMPQSFTRLWHVGNPIPLALLAPASFLCSLNGGGRIWVTAEKPASAVGGSDR